MEDLIFEIELEGKTKEAKIVFSYYNEQKDKYYIIFEVNGQEDLEAAIMISKDNDEIVLKDIETEEEYTILLEQYDLYLDRADALKNESK